METLIQTQPLMHDLKQKPTDTTQLYNLDHRISDCVSSGDARDSRL